MDDVLTQPSLFDLLARCWPLGNAVSSATFNHAQTAVAFACADGRAAVVALADDEAPGKRIRIEFDTGRTTIRPRTRPLPPPIMVGPLPGGRAPSLVALGEQGFCLGAGDGSLHRMTARGQMLSFAPAASVPVTALASHAGTEGVAAARGHRLSLHGPTGAETAATNLAEEIGVIAHAPDGKALAAGHGPFVTVFAADGLGDERPIGVGAPVVSLAWSQDGTRLCCGCGDRSVAIVDPATGTVKRIDSFPAVPAALDVSHPASALLASGTYRLAAWSLRGDSALPLKTGRPGLVLVDQVAAHPTRGIAATGYTSGLLILSHLGQAGEVLLREGASGPDAAVTALAWSDDGRHLAAGTASGDAAVITFPDQFFK
ncbi:MAG: hypothetical protein KDA73_14455 [Rhodobacteraceae bacterium]|nr:hypothetical protein [Paracoccaceae bacterium]